MGWHYQVKAVDQRINVVDWPVRAQPIGLDWVDQAVTPKTLWPVAMDQMRVDKPHESLQTDRDVDPAETAEPPPNKPSEFPQQLL